MEDIETSGTELATTESGVEESSQVEGDEGQGVGGETSLIETATKELAKQPFLRNREVAPVEKAYTPNLNFRAVDKDHVMPEYLKSAIKDVETEKQLREVFEKAYGLDAVKPKFVETKQKFEELNRNHTQIMSDVHELKADYNRGDFDSFFNRLNIPQEKVFQWVLDKVQYNQLPADQRQVLDSRRQAEQRNWELEKQNQSMQQEYEKRVVEATQTALMAELERPEIKSVSQAYDARPGGKSGDFFNRVVERGEYAWYSKKQALSPRDAVQEALELYAYAFKPQATAQPGVGSPGQKKVPVIPNISGRPTSPMKAKPRSLDDIRSAYKALQQN